MHTDELLNFQNELLNKLVAGGGPRELTKHISILLKKEVLITNPSHRVLGSTIANEDFSVGKLLNVLISAITPGRAIVSSGEQEVEAVIIELSNSVKRFGFLLICEPGLDEENKIKILAHQARAACVLELQKQEELLENSRQYRDAFLFDLLYGNIEENADIITRGEIWGWNLKLPHVVAVFELDGFEPYSEDLQLVKLLHEIVQMVTQPLEKKAILMQKNEEVVLVLPVENKKRHGNKDYLNMIIKQVIAQAEEHLTSRIVQVGVGREYANPSEIFRSYQEAKVALKLGSLLPDQNHTPFFMDLGVARILYNHDRQELIEFYQETLGDLEQYDKLQKNELMETLEKFVSHRCDLKETADSLFLHPNTLRYRLKRIEEIMKIDMKDFDTILLLMVAFKIRYLIKH